jgi:peptidoglycan/xylan/chitin deacetylase (PgdA/CDA1 family)
MSMLPMPMTALASRFLGIFCVDTADSVVALTYDDGPHPEHTPRILDVLAERGATATFFVLSRQAERHPDIVRRIIADGHELALHGRDHRSLLTMSTAEATSQVRDSRRALESIAGVPIKYFRPPYGRATLAQMARIRLLGLDIVMWSSDAYDWVLDEERAISQRADLGVFPGGIVLLHDDRGDTETLGADEVAPAFDRARVAELILTRLEERNYRTSTIKDLLSSYRQVMSAARHEMGLQ